MLSLLVLLPRFASRGAPQLGSWWSNLAGLYPDNSKVRLTYRCIMSLSNLMAVLSTCGYIYVNPWSTLIAYLGFCGFLLAC